MRKNGVIIILTLIIVLCIPKVSRADEAREDSQIDYYEYNENLYSGAFGMNFEDYDSRIEYYSIDEKTVRNASTEELLDMILSCPLMSNLYAYDNPEDGLLFLERDFNYFDEFLSRDDALEVAINAYSDISIPEQKNLDFNQLLRQGHEVEDINMLTKNKGYVLLNHKDVQVKYSVNILELIIVKLIEECDTSPIDYRTLSLLIDEVKEKEDKSEYYLYGNKHSDLVSNKTKVLAEFYDDTGLLSLMVGIGDAINIAITVTTPGGNTCPATYSYTTTMNDYDDCLEMAQTYGATLIAVAYQEFNCHSFAWLSPSYSGYSSTYTHIHLSSAFPFMSDSYYTNESTASCTGEIAYCAGGYHSAMVCGLNVYNPTTQMPDTKYVSKWGNGGLYYHFQNTCPYNTSYTYYKPATS